jgi:hypothetical protein
VPFKRWCWKIWWSQRDCRWQNGGALHVGLVRLHPHKHTPAPSIQPPIHPHTHTHARACTHAQLPLLTHTHAYTEKLNMHFFSMTTAVLWTRLNVTLYVRCLFCTACKPSAVLCRVD